MNHDPEEAEVPALARADEAVRRRHGSGQGLREAVPGVDDEVDRSLIRRGAHAARVRLSNLVDGRTSAFAYRGPAGVGLAACGPTLGGVHDARLRHRRIRA